MKYSSRIMILCVAVIFTAALAGPKAFAGGGAAGAPGEPPMGLAIQSDAAGQKFSGELFADNYNYQYFNQDPAGFYAEILRFVVRLRSGNFLGTFFMEIDCTDSVLSTACLLRPGLYDTYEFETIQSAVIAKLKTDPEFVKFISDSGVKGTGWTIKLIRFQNVGVTHAYDPSGIYSELSLSDIEIAVK